MGINSVVAAWRGVAILLLGEGRMNFTDKDYEDALRLQRVTELAKPVVSVADGIHFPSGSSAGTYKFSTPCKSAGG